MRGLEVTLFLICIVIAMPLVVVLMPGFNSGGGVAAGANDLSGVNAFNWSKANALKPSSTNTNIVTQAEYYFKLALLALEYIGAILFASLWAAPALLSIFQVNIVLTGILLSLLGLIIILAWIQIIKGDDWSGRR